MNQDDKERIHSLLVKEGGPDKLEIFDVELNETDVVKSLSSRVQENDGKYVNRIFISHTLGDEMRLAALEKELQALLLVDDDKIEPGNVSRLLGWVDAVVPKPEQPSFSVSAVVIPRRKLQAASS
jgi:hypothetical protein